jgi:hypothetical protein
MMTVVMDVQGLLSIYIGTNTVVNNQSVLQAMQRRGAVDGFDVTYSLGCSPTCNSSAGFADAVNTAAAADVVVLVVGLYPGCVVPVLCALLSLVVSYRVMSSRVLFCCGCRGGGHIPDGGPTQVRCCTVAAVARQCCGVFST